MYQYEEHLSEFLVFAQVKPQNSPDNRTLGSQNGTGANPTFPSTGTWLGDILIAILISSAGAALITAFANLQIKKREEYIDISKYKIDGISKSKPYYIRLSYYYKLFSYHLERGKGQIDPMECFYDLCNIVHTREKIRRKFGDIQLTDLDAEEVLEDFGNAVIYNLARKINREDASQMPDLVEGYLTYHDFKENILLHHSELFSKFNCWLSEQESFDELADSCASFSVLVMYELNYTFKIWYGREPRYNELTEDIYDYLSKKAVEQSDNEQIEKEKIEKALREGSLEKIKLTSKTKIYDNYYDRVSSFGLTKIEKVRRLIKIRHAWKYEMYDRGRKSMSKKNM